MLLAGTALLLAAGGASLPPVALAEPATASGRNTFLSSSQLLKAARRALAEGNVRLAERMLLAMLADPDVQYRSEARFQLAQLRIRENRDREAAVLLRRVIDDQPAVARPRLELARLLTRMGDEPGARRELRAARAGNLPPDIARLVDRWSESLWSRRPFGVSVEVAIAPDSNINSATRLDRLGTVIGDFEIGKDSRARSGVGASLDAAAFARTPLGPEIDLVGRLTGSASLYRDSDFNLVSIGASVGPEFRVGKVRAAIDGGVAIDRYGGRLLARNASLTAGARMAVGPRTWGKAEAAIVVRDHKFNRLQSGRGVSAELSVDHALTETSGASLTAKLQRFGARDPAYSTFAWEVGTQGWIERGRSTLFAGLSYGRLRADERLAILPEARRDRSLQVSAGATLRSLTAGGFAPFVRVVRERNRSNIAFYDTARTRTEVGIRRAF